MKAIMVIDISLPITYLAKFWFSSCEPKCCWPIELQDSLKRKSQGRSEWWSLFLACRATAKLSTSWFYHFRCEQPGMSKVPQIRSLHIFAISLEKHGGGGGGGGGVELLFCLQIDTKIFYKVLISFWVCVSRLAQSTQNEKLAISL